MKKPDPRPAILQLGAKALNGLAPPSKSLLLRSGAALVLLLLAVLLAPAAQAQGQVCDSSTIGNVRLLNGNAVNEGRLEICADKPGDNEGPVWGTICDDYWTTQDASVACRQLGYTHAQSGAYGLLESHFGAGSGPILLDDMLCISTDTSLLDCRVASGQTARDVIGVHNCTAQETVGIRCLDGTIDASLKKISVRDADTHGVVPLEPAFMSNQNSYSGSVPNAITSVIVFAYTSREDATIEYLDSNDRSLGRGGSVVLSNLVVGATDLKVKVTAPDMTTEMTYTVTITRAARANNPASGQPAISGTTRVGQTLTASPGAIADADGLTNAGYTYQWKRVDSSDSESDISTGASYNLTSADEGNRIRVKASFTDDRGNGEMRTSALTGVIQAAVINPPPPPPDDPTVTLLLSQSSISENGGVSTVTASVSPASSSAFTVTVSAQAVSPAVAGDFRLAGATLSFAANATQSTGSVTITGEDNDDDAPNKTVTVSGTVSQSGIEAPANVTLNITDDDDTPSGNPPPPPPPPPDPVVTLSLTPRSISESGGVSTVAATVSPASSAAFTVTVSAMADSPAVAGDFDLEGTTLSFAANATKSTGSVTITGVDNDDDAPDKTVTVYATVSLSSIGAPASLTLTITDDDDGSSSVNPPANQQPVEPPVSPPVEPPVQPPVDPPVEPPVQPPVDPPVEPPVQPPVDPPVEPPVQPPGTQLPVVTLVLMPGSISENGGVSTVTAIASPASSEAFTVTVSAAAVGHAVAGDFELSGTTLSFAANATESTGSVTISAVDNQIDAPDKAVRISGTVSLSGADAPSDVTLMITDDETAPVVTLVLMPGSISENGGVGTVTAIASPASSEAFTVTVSAAAVGPGVAGDFELSGTTLSFAANATESTGSVTISAVDNQIDAPDKQVTVSGTVSLSGAHAPSDVTLMITDDETAPVVTLVLMPGSISENGGVGTVTAIASPASSEAFTVTVSAAAVGHAVAGDLELSGTTLSFAANATESTGSVTISAVDNQIDAPDKQVTVSGTVSLSGAHAPSDVTLTITDNETPPVVTLVLMPGSISENGGVGTVTAIAAPASSEAFTVTVSAAAVGHAVAGDFDLSGTTLSFAANATESTGSVTISAVDNQIDAPDKQVTVSGTVSLSGAHAPSDVTLTITDNETPPVVTLVLMPGSISENGGVGTVTAIAAPASSEAFTVTVSAAAVGHAVAGDFELSGTTLSFAANATESTGEVTISAVDNLVDAPDKQVTVSGTVSLSGAHAPSDVTLTITDNETPPVVTLVLMPGSISENGGVSTVTAIAAPASSEAFTVTVSAAAVTPTVAGDFRLQGTTLNFAPGATESMGEATISAVDNAIDAPDKTVTVSGTVSLSGADAPSDVTLMITDDETAGAVTLVLMPGSISENGGVSTVTAIASPASSEAFTVTVSAAAVGHAVAGDLELSGTTLSFAANATESTGSVTISAVDNQIDAPDKQVTVSGTVSLSGAHAPSDVTLTITDDETAPVVTLVLMPGSISENGGVSTVTAIASPASSEAFTVTVSAAAVGHAVAGDFDLSGTTLSFAANATESTGSVTISAVDNLVDAPDKTVTVSGTVSLSGAHAPSDVTLMITDDETAPVVTLVLMPGSISENGGVSTVTAIAAPASSEAFTVTVSAAAVGHAVAGDFELSGTTLSFAANATESTGSVTISAVDNLVDAPDKMVTVSGTVSLSGADAPSDVTLTITDDETPPVVTLVLMPGSISENGGVGSVTAIAWPASSEAFTVTVAAKAVAPTVAGNFGLQGTTLNFARGATESMGEVTISAVDNLVDAPDKTVTVSGTVSLSHADAPEDVTLTIVDDESPPVVTLVLTPGSISENGGVSRVTATATPASSEAITVTISAEAVSPTVAGDFSLRGTALRFAPGGSQSTGNVSVAAVNNRMDAPHKVVMVSGTVSLGGVDAPADATLTITDDDEPLPNLSVADASGRESDGSLAFVVALNKPWDQDVTFDFTTADGTAIAGSDYLASAGTLTIAAGVTSTRIEVVLLADVLNEDDESFTLTLSNVSEATLTDGLALGVIAGGDSEATAQWLARFGRTSADHVLGAVEDQLWSQRGGPAELTVAGQKLLGTGANRPGEALANQQVYGSPLGSNGWSGAFGSGPMGTQGTLGNLAGGNERSFGQSAGRNLLSNSALALSAGSIGLGCYSIWGSGSYSRFDGSDDEIQMWGEVSSAAVGVDYSCGPYLVGVALSHSEADGNFGPEGGGIAAVESTLTGLYPYLRYQVSDRVWLWGVVGYGTGEMTSIPISGAEPEEVDLESRLAAVGARGELFSGAGGFSLSLKADALMVRTQSEEDLGLIEAEGDASRVRVGLEGAYVASFENNSLLRSHLDLSLRQDSGDADKGFGFEIGGGLDWHGLMPGLSVNVDARGLIAHGADEFEEWGFSGSIRYDPTPASLLGPRVGLTRSWGAPLNGGLRNTMWREDPAMQGPLPDMQQQQLSAELAYGFDTLGGTALPWARAGLTGRDREYRIGYSLFTRLGVPSLEMGESLFGRDYRLGWELDFLCRARVSVQLTHSRGSAAAGTDTGIMLRFSSLMRPPGHAECNAAPMPSIRIP